MTATGARVEGLSKVIRSLQKMGVEVSELKQAMSNVSTKAVSDAKSLAPVASGALESSIRASKAKASATIRAGSKKIYYASFQEFGTSRISAKEYVTKAVKDNQSYAISQIEKELKQIIARNGLN